MSIPISPPVADIDIGSIHITNSDWENNTPGAISTMANALAARQALLETVGVLNKNITGTYDIDADDPGESTNLVFVFFGSLSAGAFIVFPTGFSGLAQIENHTSGGYAITVGYATGTQVVVPASGSATTVGVGGNFVLADGILRTSAGAKVAAALEVGTDLTIGGDVTITGTLSASSGAVTNDWGVGGDLSVNDAMTANGDLNIGGTIGSTGVIHTAASLTVDVDATIAGDINVGGTIVSSGVISATGIISSESDIASSTNLIALDYIECGDGNFHMHKDGDGNVNLNFDAGDYLKFDRGSNTLSVVIDGTTVSTCNLGVGWVTI